MTRRKLRYWWTGLAVLLSTLAGTASAAEAIKVGTLLTTGGGPLYVAKDKGYFTAEGLDVELVPFDAGQPVAVATVAGAIDIGSAGVTSALYTLAGQGELRIIGGATSDSAQFHAASIVASNAAYAAGLTSIRNLAGHSVGLTQIGSTYHYALAIVAEKFGIDLKLVRTVPLQSFTNVGAAVTGGQVDAAVTLAVATLPLLANNKAKLLVWVGDETPWQVAAIWVSTKTATGRRGMLRHFLAALTNATRYCYDAAVGSDGKRRDGPNAAEFFGIVARYTGLPPDQVRTTIGYNDPELRLDEKDMARQIAWYRSQGMIKDDIPLDRILDAEFAKPLPPG